MMLLGTVSKDYFLQAAISFILLWTQHVVEAHNYGLHGLQGFDPPDTPELPNFHGPFIVTVKARFDNVAGGSYQRVFDFGNGPNKENVFLTQIRSTTNMKCGVYQNGIRKFLDVPGVIVEGELATWRFGVDADNRLWLEKNGVVVGELLDGQIPINTARNNKLLGSSNWNGNTPLIGFLSGFEVKHQGEPFSLSNLQFNNYPGQIFSGAFTASFYAQFDDYAGGSYQRVFDFGNGEGNNHIWFGTFQNTNDLYFEIHNQGSTAQTLIAPGAITNREMAFYHVGIDASGTMFIEKNGSRLVSQTGGELPTSVYRKTMLFGESNFGNGLLRGVVLGFRLDSHAVS